MVYGRAGLIRTQEDAGFGKNALKVQMHMRVCSARSIICVSSAAHFTAPHEELLVTQSRASDQDGPFLIANRFAGERNGLLNVLAWPRRGCSRSIDTNEQNQSSYGAN